MQGGMPISTSSQRPDPQQRILQAVGQTKILYETDLRNKMKLMISKCHILLGAPVDSLPSTEELEVMLNYALDNWARLTLAEIELAVEYNINQETGEFVPFYGKLSVAYISSCIRNFFDIKRRVVKTHEFNKQAMRSNTQNDPDYIVNSKLYDGLVDFVRDQGYFPQYWDFGSVHAHMTTNGLIAPWSNDQKRKVFDAVKASFIAQKTKAKVMASTLQDFRDADSFDDDSKVKAECRKIQVLCTILPEQGAKHLQELGVDI